MAQIISTGKQRAAKSSKVTVAAASLAFASWAANVTGDDIETNNFLSFDVPTEHAYNEGILGFLGCAGDFGGDWDAGVNPVDLTAATPPGLYPRDDLATVKFYTTTLDPVNVFWDFPFMRIRTSNVGAQVKAQITFTAGYQNQGIFNFPTG